MSMRSLYVPGSDSSPFTTRYRGHTFAGGKPHLTPAGKPAPPRPSRLAVFTSSATCPGGLRNAARKPSYPPVARKRSSVWLSS